jgi:excisionase family DNA binding protein
MTQIVRLNSIKQVMTRLGLGRSTVYQELASGRLQSVKVGRRRLVTESQLIDYIYNLVLAGAPSAAIRELPAETRQNHTAGPTNDVTGMVAVATGAVVASHYDDNCRLDAANTPRPSRDRMPR